MQAYWRATKALPSHQSILLICFLHIYLVDVKVKKLANTVQSSLGAPHGDVYFVFVIDACLGWYTAETVVPPHTRTHTHTQMRTQKYTYTQQARSARS